LIGGWQKWAASRIDKQAVRTPNRPERQVAGDAGEAHASKRMFGVAAAARLLAAVARSTERSGIVQHLVAIAIGPARALPTTHT
jgi:hypothetical protein